VIQLGNCGSPIETPVGWLLLTHAVGPMRTYTISASLPDLEDPTRVIGDLDAPLIAAGEDVRDGYVPNVVYSCGSLAHDEHCIHVCFLCSQPTGVDWLRAQPYTELLACTTISVGTVMLMRWQ